MTVAFYVFLLLAKGAPQAVFVSEADCELIAWADHTAHGDAKCVRVQYVRPNQVGVVVTLPDGTSYSGPEAQP